MKVIGLCGGSGSGKGAVSAVFTELGIPCIDTDAVYHELTAAPSLCLDELVCEFGESVIKDGALDRRALAEIVFSVDKSGDSLKRLNSIAHRHILARARELIRQYSEGGAEIVVVDAPVLFESGFDRECQLTLAVIADPEERIKRIMARDNMTYSAASKRINNQKSDEWLIANTDAQIFNNGSIAELREAVIAFVNDIK